MQTVDAEFTVPIVNDTTSDQSYGPATAYVNVDSFITAYSSGNYSIKNLKKATIESCLLTISNPDTDNNFANVQSCEIDFNSDVNTQIIHPATITNNPDVYADSLNVPVDNSMDVTSYMNAKQFNYTLKAKLRRPTTKVLNCAVHIKLNIEVQ
jgi:hypothetical protein